MLAQLFRLLVYSDSKSVRHMAFVRRLFNRGPSTPKSKHTNGAPASVTAEEATAPMSLNGTDGQEREVATFALS